MTNPLAPMTELDAVNQMLASIGQAPVNALDVTGIRDVSIAQLALDTTLREVLNRGWSWNTDYEYELTPDVNDNILIPSGALWVDPTDRTKDYVMRDNTGTLMFWDRENKTFTITDSPLEVNVIWAYEFTSIPQVARAYIYTRAARIFQSQVIGSDVLFKFTELHETEALAALQKIEARTKKRNMLTKNGSVYDRRYNPPRY